MESSKVNKFDDIKSKYIKKTQENRVIRRVWYTLKRLFVRYLRFKIDDEHKEYIESEITNGVQFRGAQTWVLVFAIFIASLGLNINSTAVIIGAMLISPLMGPIMGVGFGLGVSDFVLIKRSATNWAAATIFAIMSSTIYFTITPLGEASSELLARTSPSVYDILIALFGGLAGIIAMSTRQRGNVVPGVAIATALMPPLCTVGYGIATLDTLIIIGATQLYFINSVFIAMATSLGIKFLRFAQKEQLNAVKSKRVRNVVSLLLIAAVVPTIYMTYNMVVRSYYEASAINFINKQFNTDNTQILDHKIYTDSNKQKVIEVKLIGQHIPADSILASQMRLAESGLAGSQLRVMQGYQNSDEIDLKSVGNEMFGNIYKENQRQIEEQRAEIEELTAIVNSHKVVDGDSEQIAQEVSVLFPSIDKIAVSKVVESDIKLNSTDTVTVAIISALLIPTKDECEMLEDWIAKRLSTDNVRVIYEANR